MQNSLPEAGRLSDFHFWEEKKKGWNRNSADTQDHFCVWKSFCWSCAGSVHHAFGPD